MSRHLLQPGCCLALVLFSATLCAQETLPDPTRPPASMQAGTQAGSAASAPGVGDALVLQSVLLGRTPAAVISGQLVPLGGVLGGQLGDLRLASVTEHSVQLKGAQGATTLWLTPDAQKQPRPPRADHRNQPQGVEPTK